MSLNLAKLAQLGSQFGVELFEHHVRAPLPEGATSGPLFQSLFESYLPGAPNHPGLQAAVVGATSSAQPSSRPPPGPSPAPQLTSLVTVEGGGGRQGKASTSYLPGTVTPRSAASQDARSYLHEYNSRRASLHFALNATAGAGVSLLMQGGRAGGVLAKTLFDSGANMSVITRQLCQRCDIPFPHRSVSPRPSTSTTQSWPLTYSCSGPNW